MVLSRIPEKVALSGFIQTDRTIMLGRHPER